MGNCKAMIVAILICLCFARIQCDAVSLFTGQEVQMLKSKVASLESNYLDLDDEISRRKEETLQLENVVREKTAQIAALVSEIEILQMEKLDEDESLVKANAHNVVLEKQIERLGNDLEDQIKKGESLEELASGAEKSLHELTHKLEHVEKVNTEQMHKIQELDHNLQHAQEKVSEVEKEAKLKGEELAKIHGMSLPHWLAARIVHCQEFASTKWHVHGKPAFDTLRQKVADKSTHAQRVVQPQLHKAQTKWIPITKLLRNHTEPYILAVATRSTTAYRVCRNAIQPGIVRAQELADHYWQESKRFSEPYITQILSSSRPHLARASVLVEPYARPVMSTWRRLVMPASVYHRQVQDGVKHFLRSNELLKPLPIDRLASFIASSVLALPVLFAYKIFLAAFCKKVQKTRDGSRSDSSKYKNKRRVEK